MIISRLWKDLEIEKSQGPHPTMFNHFKHHWNNLISYENLYTSLTFYQDSNQDIGEIYKGILGKDWPRDDYKELSQLCLSKVRFFFTYKTVYLLVQFFCA